MARKAPRPKSVQAVVFSSSFPFTLCSGSLALLLGLSLLSALTYVLLVEFSPSLPFSSGMLARSHSEAELVLTAQGLAAAAEVAGHTATAAAARAEAAKGLISQIRTTVVQAPPLLPSAESVLARERERAEAQQAREAAVQRSAEEAAAVAEAKRVADAVAEDARNRAAAAQRGARAEAEAEAAAPAVAVARAKAASMAAPSLECEAYFP